MVARRAAALAEVAHDFSPAGDARREHRADLLAATERHLAELEAEGLPFAEEVYQAELRGETPEEAVRERRQRRNKAAG
jgi:hypothetical protein